jgi:ABC-type protease/lipase transport system fused ATPase/permease subunit
VLIGVRVRRMFVFVIAGVGNMTASATPAIARTTMLVRMEGRKSLEHEQRHEADQSPEHHIRRRSATAVRAKGVRQKVKEDDPQDHAAHRAQHQLQRRVRQASGADPSTEQACCNDERGLDGEHGGWGGGERHHGCFG